MPEKKHILLISYHFPPSTAVGGLRIANFAKYLPLYGWDTSVLTVKDHYHEAIDSERLKEIGAVKIFKTSRLPTLIEAYLRVKKRFAGKFRKRSEELGKKTFNKNPSARSGPERFIQKLKRYLISFLTLPDGERNWIIPAVIKAVREIKRNRIDCILTSSPPYSVHLIGLLVHLITGVRWAADFRDPWMTGGSKSLFMTCDLSLKIERWLEKKVIQKADMVVTNTDGLRKLFSESYSGEPANKFQFIPNGVDIERFSKLDHLKRYETFTIIYAGSIYFGRTPEPVFSAIRDLIMDGALAPREIRVQLVGNCRMIEGIPTAEIIRKYELESVVEVLDPVPYSQVLEMIKMSHIALLLAPNQPYQVPAKVYDYMGLKTKILALAEEGVTADLINSTGVGAAFFPSDIKGIKSFLLKSMKEELSDSPDHDKIFNQFDTRVVSENMARHLDKLSAVASF